MTYESELRFFQRIMNQLNLPFLILRTGISFLPQLDMGLRGALGIGEQSVLDWGTRFGKTVRENVIYYITDEFFCRYVLLMVPNSEPRSALVVGPYIMEDVDQQWLVDFLERNKLDSQWLPILENHYRRVRYLENENLLFATLQALGEQLWGVQKFTTERILRGVPESWAPLSAAPDQRAREDLLAGVRLIEQRYEAENRLMQVISQGRTQKAQMMLSGLSRGAMERRTEPTRDVKNYTIILNTLMRKAVERGGVHPLYIDRVSSEFARRIEATATWEAFMALWSEMAVRYCLLVKKHTMKNYSPLVQKVLTRVDFDLTADLSLRTTAEQLSVNASYLSTLFKQETGVTLTDYVNRKRMEHAAYLLTNTQLSISAVAQSCGIQDDNYFTKIFKKYNGKTPKQFRQEQRTFGGK